MRWLFKVRCEGDGGESGLVVEIRAERVARVGIADVHGSGNLRRTELDGLADDGRFCPVPFVVGSCEGEAFEWCVGGFSGWIVAVFFSNHEAATDMVEIEDRFVSLDGEGLEGWAGNDGVFFPVNIAECPLGETLADVLFVFGVDVGRVANVESGSDARVWKLLDAVLGDADAGEAVTSCGVVIGLVELGEFDDVEVEGEVGGLVPFRPPTVDERFEFGEVSEAFSAVGFALIPNRTSDTVTDNRGDHRVVNRGRLVVVLWPRRDGLERGCRPIFEARFEG